VIVIQNGTTKLVNVKNQDGLTKILDMVPDFVNKFAPDKETAAAEETEKAEEKTEE
ncbi:MAG: GerW family sporulation protein, partial [Lachnospiraceae bacterium]|nr:GerW family sporulation protein [Lachnospiraceae bacterium]